MRKISLALILACAACDRAASSPDQTLLSSETRDGKVRIYFKDPSGARMLLRCSAGEASDLVAKEAPRLDRWMKCLERVKTVATQDAAARHDAWLEAVEKLEAAYQEDPTHLGILRDLLMAYGQLLTFERGTPLGSNVCLVAAARLGEFEALARPLEPADHELVWHLRAWLFFVMRMTPLAAEALSTMKSASDAAPLRGALESIQQRYFDEGKCVKLGPVIVRTFLNRGKCPDNEQMWLERCYVATPAEGGTLDRTVMVALCRSEGRYYLWLYALNRSALVLPYGKTAPDGKALWQQVASLVGDAR